MIKPNYEYFKLIEPNILDGKKVMCMRDEFLSSNCKFNGTCNLDLYSNYIDWLANTLNQKSFIQFNEYSASKHTYLITTPDETLIGMLEIILYYDTINFKRKAHIVECIRPSFRRKGFGKPILKKATIECSLFGIKKNSITFERNSKACNETMRKIMDF